jgi:hypothetical protein
VYRAIGNRSMGDGGASSGIGDSTIIIKIKSAGGEIESRKSGKGVHTCNMTFDHQGVIAAHSLVRDQVHHKAHRETNGSRELVSGLCAT